MNGPVYHLPTAQGVAGVHGIRIVTEKAIDDQWTHDLWAADIIPFIQALLDEYFKNSERCETSKSLSKPPWETDCDGYAMKWNSVAKKQWNDGKEYYLKFGFGEHHPQCLIVRIHD